MFSWIRKKVANAVLSGFADALETLEAGQSAPSPLALPEPLRLRLEGGDDEEETESVAGKVKRAR